MAGVTDFEGVGSRMSIICHFLLVGSFSQVQPEQVLKFMFMSISYSIAFSLQHMTNSKVTAHAPKHWDSAAG